MTSLRFSPRLLFLCDDPQRLKDQLAGEQLTEIPADLCDNVSTDEIAPGWVCFWYDATLGRYALVGLRNGAIGPDSVKSGHFEVLVAGRSKGCGSSRETAPYAEKAAGIRLVVAHSIEKIYRQNCQNIGLLTSTDMGLIPRLRRGEPIDPSEFTAGLDPISAAVVEHGGLCAYNKARLAGTTQPPVPVTAPRPMTLAEKIIARHAVVDAASGSVGLPAVKPGDAVFCRTDVRFSHDYTTAMAAAQFFEGFGSSARVLHPESCWAFRDHLTFLGQVMPEVQKKQGLLQLADAMATNQATFCRDQGIRLYDEVPGGGAEAICHNAVLEDIALPGQLVAGTDSHTCTAGALGCLAFGVGSTDMANAWHTEDVRVSVPDSVRVQIRGALPAGCCAKDVMLAIMTDPYFREGRAIGQVLEFCGPGLLHWSVDERATLTNMAVEAGAMTGIIAADEQTCAYLAAMRSLPRSAIEALCLQSDVDAAFAHLIEIDLAALEPMVATPGDPRNGVPIRAIDVSVAIDVAYGGSCTGGKKSDIDMYAQVLQRGLERGMRVKPGVQLYIQFGSQKVKDHARRRGYLEVFVQAGAQLIDPSCGACIKAGPGVSTHAGQVTVSAINRNFPGRSGPGKVYLASPWVVAASALAGRLTTPEELFAEA